MTGSVDLEPVFQAVLENEAALQRVLRDAPAAASARRSADYLVPSVHWLYVGDTPLHLAGATLRGWAAHLLLQYGADPNVANRRGATPLHYACDPRPNSSRWNPAAQSELIALLVEGGANVDAVDRGGITPLHRAVRARSPAGVRELLRSGAQVNVRSARGSTPLQLTQHSTGAGGTAGTAAQQREILELLTQYQR